ncbi:MAG: substrate-binding domain-containing protein [Ancalomicrobiaceae bacterium]|nr:substrate-binding domain-containing protein [Ancalomicrobiaceae bacterium]
MKLSKRRILGYGIAVACSALIVTPSLAAGRTIAGIVFQQDQFFRTIQLGMQAAAKAAGAQLFEANSESKAEKEASLIDTFIARKVDAIVISPLSATASAPALKRAADAGIKIVTYNSAVNGDFPVAYLNSSQRDLGNTTGKAAAAFIKEKLAGKAKIATLGFKSQLPEISGDRVDGFLDEAKKGGDVKIVSQQDAWLAEKAVAVTADILTANPDVNIIYAANEGGTVGAVQAIRNAGLAGKVFVFGIDGTEQLANFLMDSDNVLQGVTAQQPFVMGKSAVEVALAALDGKPVEKTIIVPVIGLNRADKPGVEKFLADLKSTK